MSGKDHAPKVYHFDGKSTEISSYTHSFKASYATRSPTFELPVAVSEWKDGNKAVANGSVETTTNKNDQPTHATIETQLRIDGKGGEYVDVYYVEFMRDGTARRHLLGGADVALMRKDHWAQLSKVPAGNATPTPPVFDEHTPGNDGANDRAEKSTPTIENDNKHEELTRKLEKLANNGSDYLNKENTTPVKSNPDDSNSKPKVFTSTPTSTIANTPRWDGSGMTGFAWSPALVKAGGAFLRKPHPGESKNRTENLSEVSVGEEAANSVPEPAPDTATQETKPWHAEEPGEADEYAW